MTTGPDNPTEPDPGTPPTHQPYGAPAPSPYGQQNPYEPQNPYGQPYPQAQQQGYQPPPAYPQPGYGYAYNPPTDGLAMGAMITGIAALVLSCAYGFGLLASPAALIMGRISMKRIDRSQGQLGGRGMALAGFILGIIGTVLLVLAIVAVVILVIVAVRGGFDDSDTSTFLITR